MRFRIIVTGLLTGVSAPAIAQQDPGTAQSGLQAATPPADAPAPAAPNASNVATDAGEVIVTARRQSERLQDVPVAVTAFGGAALAARGVDTLDQVAKFAPNVRFDGAAALSGGNYNATVFIRGVGQNDFAIFSDPGVGFYVDDVYYARSIGGVMDAIDLASVQVLRGPQGTLFGKNTVGGAVLITTAAPELDAWHGQIEGIYGRYQRHDFKGALNVPIGEKAALRITAATINRDGYVRRIYDDSDEGNRNADMVRARLRVVPADELTIDLGGDYTRAREHSAPSDLLAVANVPGLTGIPFLVNYNRFVAPTKGIVAPDGQPTLNASWLTPSRFETYASGPNDNDLDLYGFQGTIAYRFGGATLKSVTAYRHMHAYFTRDGDNTPFVFRQTTNDDTQKQFSEELQLTGKLFDDRLSYVLGGFFFKEKATDIASADLAVGLDPPLPPPYSPASFPNNFTNNRSLAAYTQVTFNLTSRLSFDLGGRYSDDHKRFRSIVVRARDGVVYIDATRSASFRKFTPKVGVNYKLDRDVLIYASYSQGFKQGGFNGRPLTSSSEVTRYDPEVLDSYEAGLKSQLFDRRLTMNLAYFHSIYKDIQLTVNQTPFNFVANAAGGKIDGVEAEFVARPVSWFTANLGAGWLHARYTSVGQGLGPTQILPITVDSKFVKAPKYTLTAGAEVTHRFPGGGQAALRADITTYSRIYQDVANTPILTEDGYSLVGARASYTLPGNRLTLAVFGTNLTDERYFVSANASPSFGLAEASYGRPREWGVSVGYKF